MRCWEYAAGIAAGHPETARAGLEILAEGGTAADAAAAATMVSCVAETVMTGIAGGGHAIWWDARSGRAELLDFFVSVPGLGGRRPKSAPIEIAIPFGEEPVPYSVGIATCAVPGVPVGLDALWNRHGSLPWARLCEPAISAAMRGVEVPSAHASCLEMLEPVMTMREGAGIYAPGDRLLRPGDLLRQPGLVRTFELLADEGAATFYRGTVAKELLALMDERGGRVTAADLAAYTARWRPPVSCAYASTRVHTRGGMAGVVETLQRLCSMKALTPADRALVVVRALASVDLDGHTTNLTVVDVHGNACVVTTSLGLGSGDFIPGLDVHLNSMLGESELLVGDLEPGGRMQSMMAPTVAVDDAGLVLAAGSAGGSRLRSALVQVLAGILDEGISPQDAIDRPRLHPAGNVVHAEPGFAEEVYDAIEAHGYRVNRWRELHHYFGGASVVAANGAGADPRRSGLSLTLG